MKAKCFRWFLCVLLTTGAVWAETTAVPAAAADWQFDGETVRQIIEEIAASQAHIFLFIAFKWAVLGSLLGLVVGILANYIFHKIGWYRSEWRHARWIRWTLWIISVGLCTFLIGSAGFCKGIIRGSEHVVLKSQLATKVFPKLGDALADGVAAVQTYLSDTNAASRSETNITAKIDEFRNGTWEVNAPVFVRQMDEIQSGAVSNIVFDIEKQIVVSTPQLKSGLQNKLLHQTLRTFGAVLVQRKMESELKQLELDDLYHALRERLVSEARKQGDPNTISHPQLSAFFVKEAIVPSTIKPIRIFVGNQAMLFLLLASLSPVLPALVFRFTCKRIAGGIHARQRDQFPQ